MPRTCCVPLCSSNSRSQGNPSVTTFAFPKNEGRKKLWLKYIPRENFVPGNSAAVCIKHFQDQFIIRQVTATRDDGTILVVRRERPKLSDDAYPSIFDDVHKVAPRRRKLPDRCGKQSAARNEANFERWMEEHESLPYATTKTENDSEDANETHQTFGMEDIKQEFSEAIPVIAPHAVKPGEAEVTSYGEEAPTAVEPMVTIQEEESPTWGTELLCLHCKQSFTTQSELQVHSASCQSSFPENQCNSEDAVPNVSEINSQKLARVVQMYKTVVHTGQTLYSCEECPALFTSYFHLEQHKLVHPGSQPIFCSTLTDGETKPTEVKVLKKEPKEEKTFKCELCEETFKSFLELRLHKRKHLGSKIHCCDVCGKCFQRASKLKVHKRVHTNERPYSCEICNAKFTQLGNLNIHKRIHSGERPFQCDICKAAFMQPTHLKVHRRSHTGERPYNCNICSAAFSQLTSLILHKRSHTGERPFPCDICDLAFNSRGDLKVHKRRHTGERPYVCDICKASFTHLGTLNVHKRRHSGKRSFLCDACGVAFITHSELKTHKRRHTGEQPYHCDICGAAFTQGGSLNTHKRRHQEKGS